MNGCRGAVAGASGYKSAGMHGGAVGVAHPASCSTRMSPWPVPRGDATHHRRNGLYGGCESRGHSQTMHILQYFTFT
ncbi:hypothetical protein E2C01_040682 [Portunus trituberculatus]|uniref:Uncharacterized protein n=1 Tax=Portunus trituberculatus TaxID=210409 RepID=A0A5B7FHB7_PORTR|nr:hypothetical protein [Portunus trituberculatus]